MAEEQKPEAPEVVQILGRKGLSEASAMALNTVMVRFGDTEADSINRALQIYEFVTREQVYVRRSGRGWRCWLWYFIPLDFK